MTVGVVGPSERTGELADALDAAVGEPPEADTVLADEPSLVVAIGDAAVAALVRDGATVPVLPVDAGAGLESTTLDRALTLCEDGDPTALPSRDRPLLGVALDGEPIGRACFEVMLATHEPARISEFTVGTPGGTDRYRADGVVVATPAGSGGYASAVGGPVLDPGSACLAVVPVAAFTTSPRVRVAGSDAVITLRVERDEGAVSLLVDGTVEADVPPRRPIDVRMEGAVRTVLDPGA